MLWKSLEFRLYFTNLFLIGFYQIKCHIFMKNYKIYSALNFQLIENKRSKDHVRSWESYNNNSNNNNNERQWSFSVDGLYCVNVGLILNIYLVAQWHTACVWVWALSYVSTLVVCVRVLYACVSLSILYTPPVENVVFNA